jgi:type II secretory pathway pseudopilin PulG
MKKQNKNGYTLIELLAVIIILVTVGTIISSILTSVLRSSNKSANTENVRKNGNYAITQMSKMITYAKIWRGVSVDGVTYFPDCVSTLPTIRYKYLQIQSFDDGITTFACDGLKTTLASRSSSLLQPSSWSTSYLVDPSLYIDTCYFICTQESAASPAKIDIFLDIKATDSALFSENQADVPFETSALIRNSVNR